MIVAYKHNFCILAEGYIYFDLFNQNVGSTPVRLISPVISAVEGQTLCFTFWFAGFGAGESAELRVVHQENSSGENGEAPPLEKALQLYCYIIITSLPTFLTFLTLTL
jgi:hypothetical protein